MNSTNPLVSILIPCRTVDDLTIECIKHCRSLKYEPFEIVLLPDDSSLVEGVKVLPTGAVTPGKKRNMGASVAEGEVFAYIDSDAYPRSDWLANAIRHLREENVGAVGGPSLTPKGDGELAMAQGVILSSFLVGRGRAARYGKAGVSESDDIPSVNFVAWRRVVESVGGWDEKYWPGEDTLMGLRIRRAGYRQIIASDVVVYHHRRATWRGYARQIWNYGVHRGYFAKRFPETSRRAGYFVPSLFLVGLVVVPLLSLAVGALWWLYLFAIAAYLLMVALVASMSGNKTGLMVFIGILLTHGVYGMAFMKGLASRGLRR
jgi:cellulose synthase/poly-beta-1,6-N-acetylglucosamine synthase-like glycosyltransferase